MMYIQGLTAGPTLDFIASHSNSLSDTLREITAVTDDGCIDFISISGNGLI